MARPAAHSNLGDDRRAVPVSDLDGEEADTRMADALRKLAVATIAHFDLGPDDLPATPQHRKGRDAEAVP